MHGDDQPLFDLSRDVQGCVSKCWELSAKVTAQEATHHELSARVKALEQRLTAISEMLEAERQH